MNPRSLLNMESNSTMRFTLPNWSSYQFTEIGSVEGTVWSVRPSFSGNGDGWIEIRRFPAHGKVQFDVEVSLIDCDNNILSHHRHDLLHGQRSTRLDCDIGDDDDYRNYTMEGFVTVYYNSNSTLTGKTEAVTQTENDTSIELSSNNTLTSKKEAVTQTENETSSTAVKNIPSSQLVNDLLHLLDNPDTFSDATLVCGTTKFPVHISILSARSSVFAAMFKTQMQEGRDGNVDIVDMEPDALKAMLKYIYGGKTDDSISYLAGYLLLAADKYQLEELKLICVEELKVNMSANSVFSSVVLGELHDKSLKKYAVDFICKFKNFSDLEKTEDWKFLLKEHMSLAVEVTTTVIKYLQNN